MHSDSELVEQVLEGKQDSFAVLLSRYERLALATVLRIVGDAHLAEDALQEAFVAAFHSLKKLREPSKFGFWLVGIARKQALRALRKKREGLQKKGHLGIREVVVLSHSDCDIAIEQRGTSLPEDSMALLEIIDRLPDEDRMLIALRHFEGYSMSEIASITGRPLGTVTKKISRIHKSLQQMLSEDE
ncbi:MAG: sigma-70 family RNA polymerase sigma factor [Planctomycetota bacterium]